MSEPVQLETLVMKIVADARLHARWLNTFSFMEYIGFRKIVKSQLAEQMTAQILSHAMEEGRHALGLKKLAMKLGGSDFDSYAPETMICPEAAETYIQTLDKTCEAQFLALPDTERTSLTYLYVTWLIEKRALEVYNIYKALLPQKDIVTKLEGLLMEEGRHLQDVEAAMTSKDRQFKERANLLQPQEEAIYSIFLGQLARALQPAVAAA